MKNINRFTISGRVMRVNTTENGAFIVVGNNQDYRDKNEEWVNQAFYLSVGVFKNMDVKEGDYIAVSGYIATRPDPFDEDGKRTIITLVGLEVDNFSLLTKAREKSNVPQSSAKSKKSNSQQKNKASKPSQRRPVNTSDDDDDDILDSLFDDE